MVMVEVVMSCENDDDDDDDADDDDQTSRVCDISCQVDWTLSRQIAFPHQPCSGFHSLFFHYSDDDIDETLGVNVQFEESDDEGGDEEDVGEIKDEESDEEEGMEDADVGSTLKTSVSYIP